MQGIDFSLIKVDKLPLTLQELVDCIGIKQTFILTLKYGGRPLYIAKNPDRSVLQSFLDEYAVNALSERFSGTTLEIPKKDHFFRQLRNQAIVSDTEKGASRRELAVKYGLCLRHIGNIRKSCDEIRKH
ncbi:MULTISPECIES: Mor transcription activator family protein [Zooshikella]|uniref:Mor transcription activator domain-containing protein n=1 Tax=Zooshikella harenae TaxID=2827238 RepID=A0ABS5ZE95_9GAMM|nr:Mor transcription activator family protein [Zooshikella harenae]MBU2712153.1 hypothetical protein [Zooshikella harenae]